MYMLALCYLIPVAVILLNFPNHMLIHFHLFKFLQGVYRFVYILIFLPVELYVMIYIPSTT